MNFFYFRLLYLRWLFSGFKRVQGLSWAVSKGFEDSRIQVKKTEKQQNFLIIQIMVKYFDRQIDSDQYIADQIF